jgi:hypothetical protein
MKKRGYKKRDYDQDQLFCGDRTIKDVISGKVTEVKIANKQGGRKIGTAK